ncbi:unnamed protein product [Bursaphelenchus okinawaensis]|uniref:Uncharacterized protein n=1 Tax=Bursaphelenchus okinawaensis TaxID=465554 RepID=A0A811KJC0_9BILA|nr:unnamed protein product [Bursaphelenchus okinawaensis]CAG9104424.1 unnamed protein product [Bursaphelenchus okinawaensis]
MSHLHRARSTSLVRQPSIVASAPLRRSYSVRNLATPKPELSSDFSCQATYYPYRNYRDYSDIYDDHRYDKYRYFSPLYDRSLFPYFWGYPYSNWSHYKNYLYHYTYPASYYQRHRVPIRDTSYLPHWYGAYRPYYNY